MEKILIIDDDTDMCWVLSEVLKEEGFYVNIVNDKASALSMVRKQKYDLILLDYKIGKDDGLNVLSELKNIDNKSSIIMISAYGNNEVRKKAVSEGALEFIDKPFDIIKFVKIIKKNLKIKSV